MHGHPDGLLDLGTIGNGSLIGPSVKRLPSSVYWAALGRLGFRLFAGSRDRYRRALKCGRRAIIWVPLKDLTFAS
jgi:hypothetical protein